jgi:[ribosomal protein S18]-alanine N-acetyltransferase
MAVNFDTRDQAHWVRPMRESDLSAIMDIEARSYDFPWTEGIFRDCLRVGYYCLVLERDSTVGAYGIMSLGAGEGHILNLCVNPEYRYQGLGRYMLEHLLTYARSHLIRVAVLEVRCSNEPALALYGAMGFHKIGVRKGYYPAFGGREDALVLMLRL